MSDPQQFKGSLLGRRVTAITTRLVKGRWVNELGFDNGRVLSFTDWSVDGERDLGGQDLMVGQKVWAFSGDDVVTGRIVCLVTLLSGVEVEISTAERVRDGAR